eukprot:Skav226754  [mRNA]  locus=scaffold3942:170186:171517:- [translate_table: standard]
MLGTFATCDSTRRRRSPSPGAHKKDRAGWLLVLEFCSIGSLSEYVSSRGHLDLRMGQVVSTSLLSAAAYLHNKQIWHRDIRPQNVLLNMEGKELRPVLSNFGRACHEEADGGSASPSSPSGGVGTRPGTPDTGAVHGGGNGCYCAPEVLDARLGTIGPASDVFRCLAKLIFCTVLICSPTLGWRVRLRRVEADL